MDRLTIQRREGERETEHVIAPRGHVMQPIKWEEHGGLKPPMGRQGGLKVSQCNFFSQERQWKGLTCRGHCV